MSRIRIFRHAYKHASKLREQALRQRRAAIERQLRSPTAVKFEGDINSVVVVNRGNSSSGQSASAISVSYISQDGDATKTEPER